MNHTRRKLKGILGIRRVLFTAGVALFTTSTIYRAVASFGESTNKGTQLLNPSVVLDQYKRSDGFLSEKRQPPSDSKSDLPVVFDFTGTGNRHRSGEVRYDTKQSPIGGAFVHVGKTGGSALSILLRNGCHSFMPHPCRDVANETIASQLIRSYYHVPDFNFLPQSHHDFYLMTLRDPFERTVSAFTFEHILNKRARGEGIEPVKIRKLEFAYDCFPTLETYVSFLDGNASDFSYPYKATKVVKPCKDLARAALFGLVRPFNHFFFNLHHIFSCLPTPDKLTYYVTRQEHLYDDWVRINQDLGQTDVVLPTTVDMRQVRNHTHVVVPVSRDLSPEGTLILCKALEQEYKIYFWFLKRARNINEPQLQDSVNRARSRCPNLPIDSYLR